MSESFTLGKKENLGNIDFSKVKNGLSKKDLGIEEGSVLSSIFDSIDTNQEGVSKGKLDKHELAAFIQTVKKLAKKDNILSEKEAGRFKINGEKVDKSGKELLDFLTRLAKTTDDIEEVISEENRQIVRYKNGSVDEEETFEDGSKFVRERYGTDTVETVFDAAGNEIRSTTIRDGKIIDDTYIEYDEDGYPVSKQVLNSGKCYNYTDTDYHSGRELEGNTYTVYRYDRESQTFIEIESTSVYTDEDTNSAIKHYTNFETGDYERVKIINGLYRSHSKKSGDKIAELIEHYKPDAVAVEELFFHSNQKTVIMVAEARGVVLYAAENAGKPLFEYTPMQIKQAVTGYGRADKKQIQQMVKILLGLESVPKPDDAADALAVAVTHAQTNTVMGNFGVR